MSIRPRAATAAAATRSHDGALEDIARHDRALAAERADFRQSRVGQLRMGPVVDRDVRARAGQLDGAAAADPAHRAGNQCLLAQ